MKTYKEGDLQVWHIPQVPGKQFTVDVESVEQAILVLDVLANYDLFLLATNNRIDYANAQGLCIYEKDPDSTCGYGWFDWCDEETGYDLRQWREELEESAGED